jgi:hypothetical protein
MWIDMPSHPSTAATAQDAIEIHQRFEQVIDRVSVDRVTEAGYDSTATERARATVASFRDFIEQHRDEITALQIIYSRPYGQQRLTYEAVKELAERLQQPPNSWTTGVVVGLPASREGSLAAAAGADRCVEALAPCAGAGRLAGPLPTTVSMKVAGCAGAAGQHSPAQRWWLTDRGYRREPGTRRGHGPASSGRGRLGEEGASSWPALLDELNAARGV